MKREQPEATRKPEIPTENTTMEKRIEQASIHSGYGIGTINGVRATIVISGFKDHDEARAWIEAARIAADAPIPPDENK